MKNKAARMQRSFCIVLIFMFASLFALAASRFIVASTVSRELAANCAKVADDFSNIMRQYEHSFLLFEELLQREIAAKQDPLEIEKFLKEEDQRLSRIEGEEYDGVYMYYKERYLYSWNTPFSVYRDSGYDARKRPWYVGAVRAGGAPFFAPPYPSYANDYILATISRLQPDGETVIAYDIKLNKIQEFVCKLDIYGGSLSLICGDESRRVIGSSEPMYLGGRIFTGADELRGLAAKAVVESEAAKGTKNEKKALQKAESTMAFARFHAMYDEFLKDLSDRPETLQLNIKLGSLGFLHKKPVTPTMCSSPWAGSPASSCRYAPQHFS